MVQKDLLAVRVSKEFIPKFEEACRKLGLRKPDCHRLALVTFVKMVLQGEYQEVEEEEEGGRKVVVNVQNLSIQPTPVFELGMGREAWEKLLKILRVIASPYTHYPPEWKQWAPIILDGLERLEKASRRKTNTIHI